MIVKYDDKTAYNALFDLINQACGSNVKDLPSYYKQLDAIRKDRNMIKQSKYYKFFRIPLEEEPFHINANARTITVPAQFKANGLSVKGDQLAEVIFFDVDRYFDTMDFSACDCYIQWTNATGKESGITVSYLLDFDEDKVIFGWPINEDVTKEVGDVKFSVRFIQRAEKDNPQSEVIYSWSTLTASCPIKSGLAFDVDSYEPDDLTTLMNSRIVYSGIVNSSDGAKPYILVDLPATIDLEGLNETAELSVTAESPDNGTLSYIWYKDGNVIPDEITNTYTANNIGTYRVKIGNTNSEFETTRYQDSQSCLIPGAMQPELAPNENNIRSYSDNLTLTTKIKTYSAEQEKDLYDEAQKNVVTYQWHKKTDARAENELGEQGKQSSYAVPDNDRGIYYCTVTNTRNKDTKSIDGEDIDVRAEPKSPTEVTITAEQTEDGNLKLTAVDSGTIGVPYFQWTCSQGNKAFTESKLKELILSPDHFADHSVDRFQCLVRATEFEGTAQQHWSAPDALHGKDSNTILVTYNATDGTFTIG